MIFVVVIVVPVVLWSLLYAIYEPAGLWIYHVVWVNVLWPLLGFGLALACFFALVSLFR